MPESSINRDENDEEAKEHVDCVSTSTGERLYSIGLAFLRIAVSFRVFCHFFSCNKVKM